MTSQLRNLFTDGSRYKKSFQYFLERSDEHQSMQDFLDNMLPDVLASTVNGKTHLNVIGVGSGTGELDLKMFSVLHLNNPEVMVDNEVVEPVPQQINHYRDLVSQTPGLDYVKFNWNTMTAKEFEEHWKKKNIPKKADFIHMFQMLYYEDIGATISFFQSLLNKNGKLIISLLTGDSGWAKLDKTYSKELSDREISSVYTDDIKRYLDSKGLSYQSYIVPSQLDITECFTEGDEGGELLLDLLTEVLNFSKSASPELKAKVLELLRHPDCCVESDGKVILNNDNEVIVIEQLS